MKKIQLITLCILFVFGSFCKSDAQVEIIETTAGIAGSAGYTADNVQATTSKLNNQYLIAMDAAGNLYIADNGNARVRKVTAATGIITTVAGTGTGGFSGDGSAATAAMLGAAGGPNPGVVGVAVDAGGNFIYISDGTNNRIRVVTTATGTINTICGNGTAGYAGDGGLAISPTCQISQPRGIAVDGSGNIYFADNGNQRVRMITAATGIITTIAGNGTGGYVADGVAATTTQINSVRGLTVDAAGNVYIADMSNNRIRKIAAGTNIITTVAGNGGGGYIGDGVAATATQINRPTEVKLDAVGNIYIADVSNNRIRMVNPAGIISTVAGAGGGGSFGGDGGLATAAASRLNSPVGLAVDPAGRYFYISDRTNNRIRQVRPNSLPYFTAGTRQTITVCENSAPTSLNSLLAITDTDLQQVETWSAGAWAAVNGTTVLGGTAATTGGSVSSTGLTYTPTTGYSGRDSFTVQVSDGLATVTDTIIVIVNPLPSAGTIAGFNTVCAGSTITLTDGIAGGTWTESTGNTSVSGGVVTGLIAGNDVITYTVTNSCGSAAATQAVTVNPLPNAGTILGAGSVCTGSSIVLTDAAAGGTWSASNSNATVAGGVVTGVTAGTTDVIMYTVTNGCGTDVASLTINIITILGGGTSLAGPSTVCVASAITLTSTVAGGSWSESTGNASVAGGTVTGVIAGTDVITYSLANSCGTNNLTKTVTINPLPNAGTITGFTSVCLAGTITLADAAGGGSWSASNANATVSASGVVTGHTAGTDVISYSVSNSCGTAVATVTVNIVGAPTAGTISGASTVCQTASTTLTDPIPGGVWTASNGNATVAGGVITGVTPGTDVITYTVTFSCGTAFTTKTITVNALPVPAAISGPSAVCAGSSITLTDASAGGAWSAANANASVSATGVVTGLAAGVDIISYSVTNGCGTVPAILSVTVNPIVVPNVTFTANPGLTTCPGTSVTYTANPINGGGAPVYQWKVNSAVLGSSSAFIYTPVNGDRIICKMTSSVACPSPASISDTAVATVNPTLIPAINIAVGVTGDTVCIGDLASFSATTVNGGATPAYQWNVNGAIYSFGSTFSYAPANGDIVTCQLTSSYVCPMPATVISNSVTMTVNTTETPALSITVSPGTPICAGQPATFTVHALYGGIPPFYRWTKNGINVATGPDYIYTPLNGDIVYAMMASSATCRTTDSVFSNNITMATVAPSVVAVSIAAASGTTIGVGESDVLTATVTGASAPAYQWFVNGTAIAGATNRTFVVTGTVAGTEIVNCVATSNDVCAATGFSNLLSFTINNVGVKQVTTATGSMDIYPNPSKGAFSLKLVSDYAELVQVVITNTLGEKVKEFTTTTNSATNVAVERAAGIYFLSAITEHGNYTARLMVE